MRMSGLQLCLTCCLLFYVKIAASFHLACYYEDWAQYRPGGKSMFPSEIDPFLCSHIIKSFGGISDENTLTAGREWNEDSRLIPEFQALKRRNPDLKLILAVGGWNMGSQAFSRMASTAENRSVFTHSVIQHLRRVNFDGLDLDWEFPGYNATGSVPSDKFRFTDLCKDLYEAFHNESISTGRPRLELSAAVASLPEVIDPGHEVSRIGRYLDYLNVMTYDYHSANRQNTTSHNAPLFSTPQDHLTVSNGVEHWVNGGFPANKIVLGLPGYGQSWNLTEEPGPPGQMGIGLGEIHFRDICQHTDVMQNIQWDELAQVSYGFRPGSWFSFDDTRTFIRKCEYLKEKGFAGAMIWSISYDDHNGMSCGNGTFPLIKSISMCLSNYYPTTTTTTTTTDTSATTTTSTTTLATTPRTTAPTTKTTITPTTRIPDCAHQGTYRSSANFPILVLILALLFLVTN